MVEPKEYTLKEVKKELKDKNKRRMFRAYIIGCEKDNTPYDDITGTLRVTYYNNWQRAIAALDAKPLPSSSSSSDDEDSDEELTKEEIENAAWLTATKSAVTNRVVHNVKDARTNTVTPSKSTGREPKRLKIVTKVGFSFGGDHWTFDPDTNKILCCGQKAPTKGFPTLQFIFQDKVEVGVVNGQFITLPNIANPNDNSEFQRALKITGYTKDEAEPLLDTKGLKGHRSKSIKFSLYATTGLIQAAVDEGLMEEFNNDEFRESRKHELRKSLHVKPTVVMGAQIPPVMHGWFFRDLALKVTAPRDEERLAEIRQASADFQVQLGMKTTQKMVKENYPIWCVVTVSHLWNILVYLITNSRGTPVQRIMAVHEVLRRYCSDYDCLISLPLIERLRAKCNEKVKAPKNGPAATDVGGSFNSLFCQNWDTDYYSVVSDDPTPSP